MSLIRYHRTQFSTETLNEVFTYIAYSSVQSKKQAKNAKYVAKLPASMLTISSVSTSTIIAGPKNMAEDEMYYQGDKNVTAFDNMTNVINMTNNSNASSAAVDAMHSSHFQLWVEGVLIPMVSFAGIVANIIAVAVLVRPRMRGSFHSLLVSQSQHIKITFCTVEGTRSSYIVPFWVSPHLHLARTMCRQCCAKSDKLFTKAHGCTYIVQSMYGTVYRTVNI